MSRIPQEPPKFVTNISWIQKVLASIAVSMAVMVWVTGWDIVANIFKPDFLKLLAYLRVSLAFMAIGFTAFVGYHQITVMLKWFIENYKLYNEMKELKKGQDKK